jgi:hypothetical protein
MLLVEIDAENWARSLPERPRSVPSVRGGAGVVPRPQAGDEHGQEQQHGGDHQQHRPLAHPPPVAVGEEVQRRPPPHRRPVDHYVGPADKVLEGGDRRLGREPPAGEGQVGGRAPVQSAQPAHLLGADPLRPPARRDQQRVQLVPRWTPVGDEAI